MNSEMTHKIWCPTKLPVAFFLLLTTVNTNPHLIKRKQHDEKYPWHLHNRCNSDTNTGRCKVVLLLIHKTKGWNIWPQKTCLGNNALTLPTRKLRKLRKVQFSLSCSVWSRYFSKQFTAISVFVLNISFCACWVSFITVNSCAGRSLIFL